MEELLIKNGYVVNAHSSVRADVLVSGGRIAAVGTKLKASTPGAKVIDATGLYLLPGAIDAHTHLEMEMMGGKTFSADSYGSGTMAAACGGTTTVFDYTLQEKGGSILGMIKDRHALCDPQACVDYCFHGGISDVNDESLSEMADTVRYGVPSFKVYMVYDFGLGDADLIRVLRRSKEVGGLITVHAENRGMIDVNVSDFKEQGRLDPYHHYLSRPEECEEEADYRIMLFAKEVGAPLYIVHLANAGGVELYGRMRAGGYPIFAETCPQYLHFTSDVYKREDAVKFICSPPIKGKKSQNALWEAIKDGRITTIATDHCPSQLYEKEWGKDDFTKAPNGCMGIENMYPYMLSEANQGRISFSRAVELCSTNVAKVFGLAPKKGMIQPGSDADIVLYDPKKEFVISQKNMHSNVDYTIWEGTKLKGYPVMTMVRGTVVYKDGEFVGKEGFGEFVKRKPLHFKNNVL